MKHAHKLSATAHDWGEFLKSKRIEKGLTQAQLSEKLGYPNPQFVSLMERSLSKIPLITLGKLIALLSLNEDQIIQYLMEDYELSVRTELLKGLREQSSNSL